MVALYMNRYYVLKTLLRCMTSDRKSCSVMVHIYDALINLTNFYFDYEIIGFSTLIQGPLSGCCKIENMVLKYVKI